MDIRRWFQLQVMRQKLIQKPNNPNEKEYFDIASELEKVTNVVVGDYGSGSAFEASAMKFARALELPRLSFSVSRLERDQMNNNMSTLADIISQQAFLDALNQYLAEFARADRKRKQEMLKVFANVDWEKIHQGKTNKGFFDALTNFLVLQQPRAVLGKETLDLVIKLSQVPMIQRVFELAGGYAKLSLMAQEVYEQQREALRKAENEGKDLQPFLEKNLSDFGEAENERIESYRRYSEFIIALEAEAERISFDFDPETSQRDGMAKRVELSGNVVLEQNRLVVKTLLGAELLEAEQIATLRMLSNSKMIHLLLTKAQIALHLNGTLDRLVVTLLSYLQAGLIEAHNLITLVHAYQGNQEELNIKQMAETKFQEVRNVIKGVSFKDEAFSGKLIETV